MQGFRLAATLLLTLALAAGLALAQDVKALTAQGIEQCNDGKFDQAIATFTQALKQNPKDANVLFYRGKAYTAKGHYDRALADLNEAVKLNPGFGQAYFGRAMVYVYQEKFDQAIEELNLAQNNGYKDEDFLKLVRKRAAAKK